MLRQGRSKFHVYRILKKVSKGKELAGPVQTLLQLAESEEMDWRAANVFLLPCITSYSIMAQRCMHGGSAAHGEFALRKSER